MASDNLFEGRTFKIAVGITVLAIILLTSHASLAVVSPVTYTWKFDKFAVGINATGPAQESSLAMEMPDIIKLADGSYRMYYGASLSPPISGATHAIKSAISTDGLNWTVESGYRLLYGNLLERQRTAFSADGKNWMPANQTNDTILLNSIGNEVTGASPENPADRAELELLSGEIMLIVDPYPRYGVNADGFVDIADLKLIAQHSMKM
jgi:hypothetical protein